MKFLEKSFSVAVGGDEFSRQWERIFGPTRPDRERAQEEFEYLAVGERLAPPVPDEDEIECAPTCAGRVVESGRRLPCDCRDLGGEG